jgi:hypothetical protein
MSSAIADRRLWLTLDRTRVVEEGDPDAAFLLAPPGTVIEPSDVARLGLTARDGRIVLPGAAPEKEPEAEPKPVAEAKPEPIEPNPVAEAKPEPVSKGRGKRRR